ncbi:MAG: peptide ABC transporter substrate-binding protein [Anaerolineales bacterium]|jgi:peptide/nickel transport system substrate-binding protein
MKEKNASTTIAWAALSTLLLVSLIGCGPVATPAQPTSPTGMSAVTPEAPTSAATATPSGPSSITIVIPEEPPSFNAVISDTGYDELVMHMTLLGMTGIDPDGNIYPVLAAELPTVANGEVVVNDTAKTMDVTWKMRKDVTWADGVPVTADDMLFTYKAIADPNTGFAIEGLDKVSGVDKIDDYSFVVHFSSIYPDYLTIFGGRQVVLWPAHYCKASQGYTAWDCARTPLSDGPYVLKEWVTGDHLTFERNPKYYQPGKPQIDQIIVRIVADATVRETQLRQGDADEVMWASEQIANDVKGVSNVKLSISPTSRWVMRLFPNEAAKGTTDPKASPNPFFSDVRVRRAIRMAIDVDKITSSVWYGYAQPVWTEFFRPPYNTCNIPRPAFDAAGAQALLDQAGWVMGSNGVRVCKNCGTAPNGTPFKFNLLTYSEYGQPLILTQQLIAEMLKNVGIEADLTQVQGSVLWAASSSNGIEQSGNFDMDLYDDGYSGINPASFLNYYYSTGAAAPDAGWNVVRFENPQLDTLIDQANSSLDLPTRQAAFCQIAKLLDDQVPQILLFTTLNAEAYSSRLVGIQANINDVVSWNVADWTLAK